MKKDGFSTFAQESMRAILSLCMQDSDLGLLVGPSGIGKTFVVNEVQRKKKGVVVYRPTEITSVGEILRSLGEVMGVKVYGTLGLRLEKVVSTLRGAGVRLLVVDEADVLVDMNRWRSTEKRLSVFRQVMEAGVGVCLVGLPVLEEAVRKMPGYFQNRIGYFRSYEGPGEKEMEGFLDFFRAEVSEEMRWAALSRARSGGFFRYLKKFAEKGKVLGYETVMEVLFS